MIAAIFAIILGVLIGLSVSFHIPVEYSQYVAVAILAGVDNVVGGVKATLQKNFKTDIFISGFVVNVSLAVALAFIGNKLDVDLYLAAVIVFGTRIFQNFALIRRFLLNK